MSGCPLCRRSGFSGTSRIAVDLRCMDIPLLVIGALLILTLAAFFTGLLPYPIGWIILTAALVARLLFLRAR
jgi:hypothetical protein